MLLANLVTCVQYPLLPICVVSYTCPCGQPTSHHSLPPKTWVSQVEQSWSNWCCRLLAATASSAVQLIQLAKLECELTRSDEQSSCWHNIQSQVKCTKKLTFIINIVNTITKECVAHIQCTFSTCIAQLFSHVGAYQRPQTSLLQNITARREKLWVLQWQGLRNRSLWFEFQQKFEDKLPERSNKHTICNACYKGVDDVLSFVSLKVKKSNFGKIQRVGAIRRSCCKVTLGSTPGIGKGHTRWWVRFIFWQLANISLWSPLWPVGCIFWECGHCGGFRDNLSQK